MIAGARHERAPQSEWMMRSRDRDYERVDGAVSLGCALSGSIT
jgi:hypothetical protein